MNIQINTALSFDEQLRQWDNGTADEAALAKYLRERREDDWQAGYDAGWSAGVEDAEDAEDD